MAGKNDDRFVPPAPVGTPYRSDPADPAPFLTDTDSVPVVPVEPAPYREPANLPKHDDDDPRTEYGAPPMFQPSGQKSANAASAGPLSPDQKYARAAFWVGIASLIALGIVLGPIAIFMGVTAIKRGEKETGRRAVILGIVGALINAVGIILSALGIIPPLNEMIDQLRNNK